MKSKIFIIILFVLMWMSQFGAGMDGNPDIASSAAISATFSILGMSATMMLAPALYKVLKRPLSNSWNFCFWNSVVVLILWTISSIVLWNGVYDETFQLLGQNCLIALCYYYINTRLFFFHNNQVKKYDDTSESLLIDKTITSTRHKEVKRVNPLLLVLSLLLLLTNIFWFVSYNNLQEELSERETRVKSLEMYVDSLTGQLSNAREDSEEYTEFEKSLDESREQRKKERAEEIAEWNKNNPDQPLDPETGQPL